MMTAKFREKAKQSCSDPNMTYIDDALCPTDGVAAAFVTWSPPNRVRKKHVQISQQVIYTQPGSKAIVDGTKALFAMQAKNPSKRAFHCGPNGKLIQEL